jgi:hypothetical protein
MTRLPWGHKSRHCVYCGKVGPRTQVVGGWAHKRCIPKDGYVEACKKRRSTP